MFLRTLIVAVKAISDPCSQEGHVSAVWYCTHAPPRTHLTCYNICSSGRPHMGCSRESISPVCRGIASAFTV